MYLRDLGVPLREGIIFMMSYDNINPFTFRELIPGFRRPSHCVSG